MNISPLIADNVMEILVKIIDFTASRHKALTDNIENLSDPDYIPMDLPVAEFAKSMEAAIEEHQRSRRLLFCDTQNVRFGISGNMEIDPVVDNYAYSLLAANSDEYLELQLKKLAENSLNQRIAAELLKQKQELNSIVE